MEQNSECSHSLVGIMGKEEADLSHLSLCFSRPLCAERRLPQVLRNPSPGGCHLLQAPSPALDHFTSSLPPSSLHVYFPMLCFFIRDGFFALKTLSFEDQGGFVACTSCSTSGTTLIILLCLLRRVLWLFPLTLRVFVLPLCQSL